MPFNLEQSQKKAQEKIKKAILVALHDEAQEYDTFSAAYKAEPKEKAYKKAKSEFAAFLRRYNLSDPTNEEKLLSLLAQQPAKVLKKAREVIADAKFYYASLIPEKRLDDPISLIRHQLQMPDYSDLSRAELFSTLLAATHADLDRRVPFNVTFAPNSRQRALTDLDFPAVIGFVQTTTLREVSDNYAAQHAAISETTGFQHFWDYKKQLKTIEFKAMELGATKDEIRTQAPVDTEARNKLGTWHRKHIAKGPSAIA